MSTVSLGNQIFLNSLLYLFHFEMHLIKITDEGKLHLKTGIIIPGSLRAANSETTNFYLFHFRFVPRTSQKTDQGSHCQVLRFVFSYSVWPRTRFSNLGKMFFSHVIFDKNEHSLEKTYEGVGCIITRWDLRLEVCTQTQKSEQCTYKTPECPGGHISKNACISSQAIFMKKPM